jgi:transcriptional regulator with XRE-family HTH domain
MFLSLSGQIEGQLREAYDRKFRAGLATQSSLAKRLGVNRSAIHRRLTGHTNMTIETIADMVWALDHDISVEIFDPSLVHGLNYPIASAPTSPQPAHPAPRPELITAAPERDPDPFKSLREQAGASAAPVPAPAVT